MKLIDSHVGVVRELEPLKKIEYIGRTCYKSTSDFTDETAEKFFDTLVKNKHFAMLEHVNFVFDVSNFPALYDWAKSMKFFNCTINHKRRRLLVSANLRTLNEFVDMKFLVALNALNPKLVYCLDDNCDLHSDSVKRVLNIHFTRWVAGESSKAFYPPIVNLEELPGLSLDEFENHFYMTFKFICDRGVTHEIVRHRVASYAQESTRYCNYSKEKYGREVTFIKPADFVHWDLLKTGAFCNALKNAEESYMSLIDFGCTPQEARAVLPNAVKTEIVMTANAKEYNHFFDLRSRGLTGAPHPDMKVVADKALKEYEEVTKKFIFVD